MKRIRDILLFLQAFVLYSLCMGTVVVALALYSCIIVTNNAFIITICLVLVIKVIMVAFKWFGEVE